MPGTTIEAEIDRCIAMPAQALAYQVGNIRFREIRRRAEQRLGANFNIRDFHDALMSAGLTTLEVLDQIMDGWIGERGAAAA
jgi:uncharacterized protein (DUF885 family)